MKAEEKGTVGAVSEGLTWDDEPESESQKPPIVDLNGDKTQEKIVNLILHGAPPADKKGHYEHLQFKIAPYQADIMDKIRSMAPKNHWRSQSEYLRCTFTVGNFIIMKFLQEAKNIREIDSLFQLCDMMLVVAKHQHQESLKNEFTRAIATVTEHEADIKNMVSILTTKLQGK